MKKNKNKPRLGEALVCAGVALLADGAAGAALEDAVWRRSVVGLCSLPEDEEGTVVLAETAAELASEVVAVTTAPPPTPGETATVGAPVANEAVMGPGISSSLTNLPAFTLLFWSSNV